MSMNRVNYFVKKILQNSKLNRDNFVKNKKIYNYLSKKNKINHKLILKRKFATYTGPPNFNNNNNKCCIIFVSGIIIYTIIGEFDNRKNL